MHAQVLEVFYRMKQRKCIEVDRHAYLAAIKASGYHGLRDRPRARRLFAEMERETTLEPYLQSQLGPRDLDELQGLYCSTIAACEAVGEWGGRYTDVADRADRVRAETPRRRPPPR